MHQNKNTMTAANNPALKSWIEIPENNDFPIQNIPFGIIKTGRSQPRMATIIGDIVIDLSALAELEYFDDLSMDTSVFYMPIINDFMALGKETTRAVRNRISAIFQHDNAELRDNENHKGQILYDVNTVSNMMPIEVGDYTDFYSSREHATNIGTMFRDPENALLPNWLHLPVGYHGRASSIVVSGTPIHRPKGQQMPAGADKPVYGASKLLDFELEMGFVVGQSSKLGASVSTDEAEDYIFGLCLFNDWSARDIQKWEYVPLGPFLGKSFASSISPWIVTLDALDHFRISGPEQNEPEVLPYLQYKGDKRYNINLEVLLQPEDSEAQTISRSNFKYMYWNMCQQLAHHTVNGCNLNVGDMCASGTISGTTPNAYGSMLELSWRGTKPLPISDGSERKFIQDGDTLILRGFGEKDGLRIGFGEVSGKVLPAL